MHYEARSLSYRDPGILAIAAGTCAADHTPPRGAEIPRSFNSFSIERSEFAPAVRMSSMTGAIGGTSKPIAELMAKLPGLRQGFCRSLAYRRDGRLGQRRP